ncbi:hypothetical protein [Butyrivibrio sp. INlla14]|uniref:hypothetical protein n=1 Tax=Butyrivibrio sp. INlla14 TaxID=1520808 RepID=UPI00115F9A90|nr:hypothetical protein [Butyrivibrio sp. INlla14]
MSNKYNEVMDKIEVTEEMRSRILQNIANEFSEDNTTDEDTLENKVETPIEFSKRAENRKKSVYSFTRYIGVAAAAVVLFIGAAAVFDKSETIGKQTGSSLSEKAQELTHEAAADLHNKESEFIKNSWVKYESVEKMAEATGTDFTEIEYLSSVSSEVDYYLDNGTDATIVYDVSGNAITITQKKSVGEDAGTAETQAPDGNVAESEAVSGTAKETSKPNIAIEAAPQTSEPQSIAGSAQAESDSKKDGSDRAVVDTITAGNVEIKVSGTEDGYNRAFWTVDGIDYSLDSAEKINLDEMTELMNNILAF